MLVSVDWHSTYRYEPPVRLLNMELHVVPAAGFGQELVEHRLTVEPTGPLNEHTNADPFGNTMHRIDLLGPVDRVRIELAARIRTADGPVASPRLTPLLRVLALQSTHRAPHHPRIADFVSDARGLADEADPLAYADVVSALVAERCDYVVGETSVDATALDLLEHERGVCQDYAHLMLAALRMRGIPALYVSGYLAPDDGAAHADASHAWVRVHAGGAWHGVDAANRCREDERYVVTALGRDYDDVAPVRGSYRGLAEESWSTAVRVEGQGQQ